MASQIFADEYDLSGELTAEDLLEETRPQSAFVDPDDDEYDWTPLH